MIKYLKAPQGYENNWTSNYVYVYKVWSKFFNFKCVHKKTERIYQNFIVPIFGK